MKAESKILNEKLKNSNYKFLGWQNGWLSIMLDVDGNITTNKNLYRTHGGYSKEKHPEYNDCRSAGHKVDEVSHNNRGSENTVSCDICKIYWKYDCSG